MKYVRDIEHFDRVPILVRSSLNVPLEAGIPVSTFRLRRAVATIRFLQERGARVIIAGHIGRDPLLSMKAVFNVLKAYVPNLSFSGYVTGRTVLEEIRSLPPGSALLLENLRRNPGEPENDRAFAKSLAELADAFVQDSFDACHRRHASIVGVPELLPSYAGLLLEEEIEALSFALEPKRPALAIVGGAKFQTKQPLIEKLLERYDRVFIGGAIGNDLLKARGYEVGRSIVSGKTSDPLARFANDPRVIGPVDVVVSSPRGGGPRLPKEVQADEMILDAGPQSIALLEEYLRDAKTVLWNGPLGNYENGYREGNESLAQSIADSHAYSIVGGGDTVVSLEQLGIEDRFSFISTGGGAMLEYLVHGTLPGIDALR